MRGEEQKELKMRRIDRTGRNRMKQKGHERNRVERAEEEENKRTEY